MCVPVRVPGTSHRFQGACTAPAERHTRPLTHLSAQQCGSVPALRACAGGQDTTRNQVLGGPRACGLWNRFLMVVGEGVGGAGVLVGDADAVEVGDGDEVGADVGRVVGAVVVGAGDDVSGPVAVVVGDGVEVAVVVGAGDDVSGPVAVVVGDGVEVAAEVGADVGRAVVVGTGDAVVVGVGAAVVVGAGVAGTASGFAFCAARRHKRFSKKPCHARAWRGKNCVRMHSCASIGATGSGLALRSV